MPSSEKAPFHVDNNSWDKTRKDAVNYIATKIIKTPIKIDFFHGVRRLLFIPQWVIDEVATENNVEHMVHECPSITWDNVNDSEGPASMIYDQGKRLFTYCLYYETTMAFTLQLGRNGVLDRNLPVRCIEDLGEFQDAGLEKTAKEFFEEHHKAYPPTFQIGQQKGVPFLYNLTSLPFTKLELAEGAKNKDGNVYDITVHENHLLPAPGVPFVNQFDFKMKEFHNGLAAAKKDQNWSYFKFGFWYGNIYFLCY